MVSTKMVYVLAFLLCYGIPAAVLLSVAEIVWGLR